MAINKKLIHFKTFENFNSKKLSANEENTQYTIGIDGEIQSGSPDILYQSIVYIKDTKQQWTHGLLYNENNLIVPITYNELVVLRNNNQLIPGIQYRITDYVTTCNNNGCNNLNIITESEMHPFDILIQASSTNSLCENASLLLNEEDSYFNNINLSKFEIKYDINNDSSKYLWADTENGKGVIYYMKDLFMNECCYDFLNITFTFTNDYSFTGSTDEFRSNVKYYTFSHEDNSIIIRNDSYFCHSNIIKQSFLNGALLLNCNLFKTTSNTYVSSNFLDEGCFENKFGPDCYKNILGKNCYGNNFLLASKYNNFGNNCSYNHLSKNCSFISLGGNCYNNTFNEQCLFITTGKSLYMCNLGKNCSLNSFKNNCYNITLGNYSVGNYFMNDCQNVVFGEYSSYNVFENNCLNITMRVNASTSGTSLGYFLRNKISSGTQNVIFYTGVTTSSSKKISNIHVKLGIYGSTSSPKYINVSTLLNRTYETIITKNSSNEIKFNIIDEKQDVLISGTNIKTVNGTSILGSGNITIESGQIQSDWNETDTTSKSYIANKPNIPIKTSELENDSRYAQFEESSVYGSKVLLLDAIIATDGIISNAYELKWNNNGLIIYDKSELENIINITKSGNGTLFLSDNGTYKSISTTYPQVNHGTSDTTFALTPNVLHVWDEVAELSLTLANPTDTTVANEYIFQFTSGATATTLTLPDTIKWANDAPPIIVENMIYQVSILNGLASILEFSNAAPVVLIIFYFSGSSYSAEKGMTWEQWCNSTYNITTLGISGNMVMDNGRYNVIQNSSGVLVYGTDIIIENEYYYAQGGGGTN